ncbi:MFS general substrate transporter [Suhomyces tanzawaensis NRRL Y-17324]|uniref:MFS general substrate transporter n=1 Tax=Suhomyces tanzawaensis NRRL Y-17324 TaxID=984487 RepID=A0A1E4SCH9_9ASCO|nr:MFS general substrate transporter [Suhomyces tanzawaensis NRRL Y-17324]ODV77227.1 MFS general substrate transporter [Suhomyces tanzawaensis NRRL Y-17324]
MGWIDGIYVGSKDWRESRLLKCQIVASFLVFILFGLAEQAIGTMIPKFQAHYHINDKQVSLIFLSSVFGYFTMGLLSDVSHQKLGIRGVVTLGSGSMTLSYLITSTRPPFPILLICFVMAGIGCGCLDACLNTWMGALADSNELLGILHGCYGVGSMIAPPVITYLLEKENPWAWNEYYHVLTVLGAMLIVIMSVCFRHETPTKYKFMLDRKHQKYKSSNNFEMQSQDGQLDSSEDDTQEVSIKETLTNKKVLFFALILCIYVGNEVAFGAWMITFLTRIQHLEYRLSSYIATSFWSGLTVGRIVLGFATSSYFKTELTANLTYIAGSFLGTFVFWIFAFTNIIPLLFVIVFVTGMAIGPIFPTTIVTAINVLPVRFETAGVGFICAFGGGGAAILPFFVGLVADSSDAGLTAYPLIVTAMFGVLLAMWVLVMATHAKSYGRKL